MLQSLRSCTALGLLTLSLAAGSALAQAGSPGRDAAQTKAKDTVETSTDATKKADKMKPKTSPSDTRRVEDGANPPAADAVRGTKKADCPPAGTGGVQMPDCKEGAVDSTGATTTPGVKR